METVTLFIPELLKNQSRLFLDKPEEKLNPYVMDAKTRELIAPYVGREVEAIKLADAYVLLDAGSEDLVGTRKYVFIRENEVVKLRAFPDDLGHPFEAKVWEVSSIGTIEPFNGTPEKAWVASHGEQARPVYDFWERGSGGFIVRNGVKPGDLISYGWSNVGRKGTTKWRIASVVLEVCAEKITVAKIGDEKHAEAVAFARKYRQRIQPQASERQAKLYELKAEYMRLGAEIAELEKELVRDRSLTVS